MIKDGIGESLGLDMYEAHRDGEELPEIDLKLEQGLEKLEELLKRMTSFKPHSRPSSLYVQEQLSAFAAEVIIRPIFGTKFCNKFIWALIHFWLVVCRMLEIHYYAKVWNIFTWEFNCRIIPYFCTAVYYFRSLGQTNKLFYVPVYEKITALGSIQLCFW